MILIIPFRIMYFRRMIFTLSLAFHINTQA
jgi:hypothetical protein